MTPVRRAARALYSRASGTSVLRRPLAALRSRPGFRALARRHVDVLLSRGTTWANVDGALRLLAEDPDLPVVFGPWEGDAALELLYWAPFVRWALEHHSLDPARVAVVSRGGVAAWYEGACGAYADTPAALGGAFARAAVFPPDPVLALVEEYRRGSTAPRPLLKRARHVRLPLPGGTAGELPERHFAVALPPSPAFPDTETNREAGERLARRLSAARPLVTLDPSSPQGAWREILARADGLLTAYSGVAVLGVASGVPTVALRSADGEVAEPDLDLLQRLATALGTSLTILDVADLAAVEAALGGLPA